jgi:Transposase DDE domain
VLYQAQASDCGNCSLKPRCTQAPQRMLSRHMDEDALNRMHQRATPEIMRFRRSTVEHPFAILKYRIFGHPRFLLRGLEGSRTEISLAVMAYNIKRMVNLLGGTTLNQALQST